MKKILCSIFIINILLSFFLFLDVKREALRTTINELGQEGSIAIEIKQGIDYLDRKETLEKIEAIVKEHDGSITKKIYINKSPRITDVIQYVSLNNPEFYFRELQFSGSLLTPYADNETFLTSSKDQVDGKIGTIETLDEKSLYEIRSFQTLAESKKSLSGIYYINLSEKSSSNAFINDLNQAIGIEVTEYKGSSISIPHWPILELLPILFLYILSAIIVLYTIFYRFKAIGIKKLVGFKNITIAFEMIESIIKTYLIAVVISCFIIGIFYFFNQNMMLLNLILMSLLWMAIIFIINLIVLIIPLFFLEKIKISEVLKNRRPTHIISRINMVFKIIFTSILMILLVFIFKNHITLSGFYNENYLKWEETKNHAYVPLMYMEMERSEEQFLWEVEQMKKLYWKTNNAGGIEIYIPFDIQDSESKKRTLNQLIEAEGMIDPQYAKAIKLKTVYNGIRINNNYLKANPIYDLDGNAVQINENDHILYILLPEKLKYLEKDAIEAYAYPYENDLFTMDYAGLHEHLPHLFDAGNPEVKVILVKDNQKYFTYNFEAFKEDNNYIIDPIVEINNNKIEYGGDISNNRGYYIKVDNPQDPFASISEEVKRLGLTAQYNQAFSLYDGVAEQVYESQSALIKQLTIAFVTGFILILLVIYSTIINMEKIKVENSICILNGYGFIERHKRKLLFLFFIYLILGCLMVLIGNGFSEKIAFAILVLSVWVIELIVTIITIFIIEKQNLNDILKGR